MDLGLISAYKILLSARRKTGDPIDWRPTCAHDPIPILTNTDTLACLLEFEVLEEFDPICILRVVLETALSPPCQPFWQRSRGGRPRDRIDGNAGLVGQLHLCDHTVHV